MGGYYYPIYGECSCTGARKAREDERRASEEFSRQIAEKQATCQHEWRRVTQDGVGYYRCPKCGATSGFY